MSVIYIEGRPQYTIDEKEAPAGYYPVMKSDLKRPYNLSDNICDHCDWRSGCNKAVCSCMDYDRRDKVSVYFKKCLT